MRGPFDHLAREVAARVALALMGQVTAGDIKRVEADVASLLNRPAHDDEADLGAISAQMRGDAAVLDEWLDHLAADERDAFDDLVQQLSPVVDRLRSFATSVDAARVAHAAPIDQAVVADARRSVEAGTDTPAGTTGALLHEIDRLTKDLRRLELMFTATYAHDLQALAARPTEDGGS